MSSSFVGRAAKSAANVRHLLASMLGAGGALIFAKFVLPPGEAEAAGDFQQPAGEEHQQGGSPTSSSSSSKDELQLVQVVFRHGARTPLGKRYWPELGPKWDVCGKAFDAVPVEVLSLDGRPRPTNPDDERQVNQRYPGGCSKGELTLVGQEQAREFGRWLRWRYHLVHGLLPERHEPGVVNARTTNYSRTVATLQGVLSGLFPGTKEPIVVHTTEEIDEILYHNVTSCGKLYSLMKGLKQQLKEEMQKEQPPHTEELQQRVQAALGLPPEHKIHWVDLHDAMTTMLTHGKDIPAALREQAVLRGINQHATERFMHLIAPHPDTGKHQEVLRLGMGVLMEMMVRRMESHVAEQTAAAGGSSTGPGMYLYSGHDSSLMPLLAALGKPVTDWPPYLSNLTLELWRQPQGQQYVKVLYNQKELPLTELCGGPTCELQQFRERVLGPYLLTKDEHEKECLLHFLHDQPAGEHTETEAVQPGSAFPDDEAEASSAAGGAGSAAEAGTPAKRE
ncbi:hypothetical protein ABPG77_009658 [Micractinium sp. CCAP 211/92]